MSLLDEETLIIQAKAGECWIFNPSVCIEGKLSTEPKYKFAGERIRKFYKLGDNILGLSIASLILWSPKGVLMETQCLENACEFIRCSTMC
jgi:hypothetical protein